LRDTQNTSGGVDGFFDDTFYALFINRAVPGGNGSYVDGSTYATTMYNKALTTSEILQNYNAIKTRFGL
jgi:hypothetical protein